jgi:Ca2+-transporting ATPase
MNFKDIVELPQSDVYWKLESDEQGLSQSEVEKRLDVYGQNKIASRETTAWDIFKRQFKSPFVFLLFGAGALSFALGERVDAAMIFLFVAINTALGFYQEYKSEQTVKLLKKYLGSKIRVLRNGTVENINTELLVPGDVVLFEPGDIIPADCRFIESYNLVVDETVLT